MAPRYVRRLAGSTLPPPRVETLKPVDHCSTSVAAAGPNEPLILMRRNGREYGIGCYSSVMDAVYSVGQ
jgi:hypothetical protein